MGGGIIMMWRGRFCSEVSSERHPVVCGCCSSVPGKDKLGETLKKKPLGAKPKLSSSRPSHDSIVSQMIRAAKKL